MPRCATAVRCAALLSKQTPSSLLLFRHATIWSSGPDLKACVATLFCLGWTDQSFVRLLKSDVRVMRCSWLKVTGTEASGIAIPDASLTRRARRQERVRLADLRQFGLILADWQGAKYQLANRTRADRAGGQPAADVAGDGAHSGKSL
jgi:hypothetical protein